MNFTYIHDFVTVFQIKFLLVLDICGKIYHNKIHEMTEYIRNTLVFLFDNELI